jgi:poly(3-hydroxybutyrate) depolymerase
MNRSLHFPVLLLAGAASLVGCEASEAKTDTGAAGSDDGGTADGADGDDGADGGDGSDGSDGEGTPGLRPVGEPTAACPDMTSSGYVSFDVDGVERMASVVVPASPSGEMGVLFFFHGLMDTSTGSPSQYMVDGLEMQLLADELNVVVLLPDSPTLDLFGFQVYLWDLLVETDNDLRLIDELRACADQQLEIDLERVSAWGFSGGALFTTVVARERGDVFASILASSGGSDIEVPIWSEPGAAYGTPAYTMPALIQSGGEADVWPDPSIPLVDFQTASDTFAGKLAADGHAVIRCTHSSGHTITNKGFSQAIDWVVDHRFGEPGPMADAVGADDESWCEKLD